MTTTNAAGKEMVNQTPITQEMLKDFEACNDRISNSANQIENKPHMMLDQRLPMAESESSLPHPDPIDFTGKLQARLSHLRTLCRRLEESVNHMNKII